MTDHKPLKSILVLDLSQGLAGPSCAGYLAEYGARVIKVEPPEGDWARPLGVKIDGSSGMSFSYNRGKESLCLDLKAPEARPIIEKLARTCDVFMQSARPGAMERLGLGFEDIRKLRPNVVYLSVSGFGITGPYRAEPLTDTAAQAFAGLMAANRGRDGAPHKVGSQIVDNVTGLYAFQAVVMALWGRTTETPATHLDVSLMQSAAAVLAHNFAEHSVLGRTPDALNPPAGTFPTADGWIAITLVHEEHWRRICAGLGMPRLATDPRFRTFADRRVNLDALIAIMDARLSEHTTAEWHRVLLDHEVLASPVNDYGAVMGHAQVLETNGVPEFRAADGTRVRVPRTPGMPPNTGHAPALGEHSRSVLKDAGLADGEIDRLVASGAVKDSARTGAKT